MPKRRKSEVWASSKKRRTTNSFKDITGVITSEEEDVGDIEAMADEGCVARELEESGANFLTTLNIKKRVPRTISWESKGEVKSVHYLLPLKSDRGRLIHQQPIIIEPSKANESSVCQANETDEEEGGATHGSVASDVPEVMTTTELFAQRQEKLAEIKEAIASHASQLMEDPEGNISQLKHLRALCSERDPDIAITVRKLAMTSFMTVMKDIAPSYHIRELTDAEKAVKVSKDIKKLRHFEQTLLLDYRNFLSLCDETIKIGLCKGRGAGGEGEKRKRRRRERNKPLDILESDQVLTPSSMERLAEVALKCFCELLVSLPHFNFANNIIASLVPLLPSKCLHGTVSQMCCSTIEKLFRNDVTGQVSFEAVLLISKLVKAKGYKTKPAVLSTLLELRLSDIGESVAAAGSQATTTTVLGMSERGGRPGVRENAKKKEAKHKLNKKQKMRLLSEAKLERDLQEVSAIESKAKRTEMQTKILKVIFLTYFRILKNSRHSPLLQPVLEGLAKFSHLINVDFFADLMSLLHSLAETGGLSNKECMLCVTTAFEILSGQGSALHIDPRQFYVQLYSALLTCSSNDDLLLAINCLDKLLKNTRKVPIQRVLGFVKRLSTVCLQLQPEAALAVLATLKRCIQSYSQCEQLLDVDAMAGSGLYRPDVPDPDMSFSSSTSLWELADLRVRKRLHYEPTVVTYAKFLLHGAPSQGKQSLTSDLARKNPKDFLLLFDDVTMKSKAQHVMEFNPMVHVPAPPPHPGSKLARKKKGMYWYSESLMSNDVQSKAEKALAEADKLVEYN